MELVVVLSVHCKLENFIGLDKGSKTSSFFSKAQFSRTANDAAYDSNKCTNALNRTMEVPDHARGTEECSYFLVSSVALAIAARQACDKYRCDNHQIDKISRSK